jgi:hypothetical protein
VDSTEMLVCQSTVGWNVTKNDYSPNAATESPLGVRETAKSYMDINKLACEWFLPNGIVINMKDKIYMCESEWALLLNPQVIVLGGSVAVGGSDLLLEPLNQSVLHRCGSWVDRIGLQITLSQLGDQAGLLGAASLVWLGVR